MVTSMPTPASRPVNMTDLHALTEYASFNPHQAVVARVETEDPLGLEENRILGLGSPCLTRGAFIDALLHAPSGTNSL